VPGLVARERGPAPLGHRGEKEAFAHGTFGTAARRETPGNSLLT
jgi:hypothetical protein